jgi:hypothetical protein
MGQIEAKKEIDRINMIYMIRKKKKELLFIVHHVNPV